MTLGIIHRALTDVDTDYVEPLHLEVIGYASSDSDVIDSDLVDFKIESQLGNTVRCKVRILSLPLEELMDSIPSPMADRVNVGPVPSDIASEHVGFRFASDNVPPRKRFFEIAHTKNGVDSASWENP